MKTPEANEQDLLNQAEARAALKALESQLAEKDAELQREIEARLELEKMLHEAGQSGDRLVETLREVIYATDGQGLLTYLSPAVEQVLGYRPSEMVGRHISEFIGKEDQADVGKRLQQVLEGEAVAGEVRVLTKSGHVRWMRTSSQAVVEGGRAVGVQGVMSDTTDRRLAEQQIRKQNEFLVSVLESLTHPFYVLDANDYTIQTANSAARMGSLKSMATCYALTHRRDVPCDTADHPCPVVEIKRTKAPVTVEHIHYDEQGNARQVEVHGYPIFDDKGNVVQVIEYSFDITERKQAEAALRESEARWRTVTENSPDHVILLDTDLRIQFINYAAPGLAVRELIGRPLYSLAAEDQQAEVRQILERAVATGDRVSYETTYQVPEGDTFYYESRVVPRIVDGQIVGLAVNSRDVTQHRQDEAALRRSERRYRQLLDALHEGIWVIDENAKTTFVNPHMAEMLGYTVDEMQGKHLYSFMDDRGVEITRRNLERRAQGISEQHDFEFLRKDGSRMYALLETSPIYDDEGNYRGGIAGIQDITERRRAGEALRESETLLNETQRMVGLGGWTMTLSTSQVTWTDEVYRIHEVPPDFRPTLENALSFYHPQDRPLLEAAIQRALEEGEPWDLELRFITAKGKRLWVRATGKSEYQEGKAVRLTGTFQDISERKEAEKALEEAAAAAERNRLARDLHDSVTQALFSASLVAEVLPQAWKRDPDAALEGLEELRMLTRGALAEMRTMLLELRPHALVETGLDELLFQLTEAVTNRMQLAAAFRIEPCPPLPPEVHIAFYRIAQEALNNIVKHASADQVTVSLRASPEFGGKVDPWQGVLALQISDDGRGLAADEVEPGRLGLSIMRERADGIGARLGFKSERDGGTQVTLVWPKE